MGTKKSCRCHVKYGDEIIQKVVNNRAIVIGVEDVEGFGKHIKEGAL